MSLDDYDSVEEFLASKDFEDLVKDLKSGMKNLKNKKSLQERINDDQRWHELKEESKYNEPDWDRLESNYYDPER